MKILALCGSYHKNGAIDTLMDKAIEGIKSVDPAIEVEKVYLIDKKILYCKGCMVCFYDDPSKPVAQCVIDDDMQELSKKLNEADGYIFGTPIFMGTVTALMKTFCERFCWVLAKPGTWPIKGGPAPRTNRKKAAIIILSSGVVPAFMRMFCDDATKFFRESLPCILNAKITGSLYAGAVGCNQPQPGRYFSAALTLGEKLARAVSRLQ